MTESPGRLYSLDALRGLAVFLMIEQHVGIWMWRGPARGETVWDHPVLLGFNALGGGAAPLFVSLAGVGSALFVAGQRPRTDATLVRRGLVLMLFGLALNFMSPSWFSWGSWFVLHMMGFAMALGPLWRRLPNWALLVGCGAVLVSTVLVRLWLDTPISLTNQRMRDVTLPGGAFRLALAESQFPILPWLTFYLAGFVAGRWLLVRRYGHIALLGLAFFVLGGGGHLLWKAGALPGEFAFRAFEMHLGFFPASVAIVGLLLGGALVVIALVSWFETKRPLRSTHPMVTLGRISLTLLMIHVPLFRDLSRPFGLWRGLGPWLSLTVVFGFFALALLAAVAWKRIDYRYGAEWLLRRLAG
jgi:uncharacterized membrane protein